MGLPAPAPPAQPIMYTSKDKLDGEDLKKLRRQLHTRNITRRVYVARDERSTPGIKK